MPFDVSYGPVKVGYRAEASATTTRPSDPDAQSLRTGSVICQNFFTNFLNGAGDPLGSS